MIRFQKLIIKYRLIIFFLLSYLLSWAPLALIRGLLPHGVFLAAVIVIFFTTGKKGLREYWNRLTNFRAKWLFYLAASVIVIVFKLGDVLSNFLSGATYAGFPGIPILEVAGILLLFGGQWEEPGWSGYALPALQKRFVGFRYGILKATLILGIFRGIWHLPLVIVGAIPWYDAIWFTPFVYQPIITWLYNKSRGSVPLVMFFHYMTNLLFALSPGFAGANRPLFTILYMAFGGITTLVLLWKTQFKLGWSENF